MTLIKFAILVENEVADILEIDDQSDNNAAQRFLAALRSNPEFVEYSSIGVHHGWSWDGNDFHPPIS